MSQILLDLADSTVVAGLSIYPQSTTGVFNGTGVDFQQSDLTVQALCEVGTVLNAGAANTFSFSFQEAVDNATWTNIADPRAVLSPQTGGGGVLQIATFSRTKRYVRAVLTGGGGYNQYTSVVLLAQQRLQNPSAGFTMSPQV